MLEMIQETLKRYGKEKMSDKVSDKMSDKEEEVYLMLYNYLQSNEVLRNKDAVKIINRSEATARRYLNLFVEYGLLEAVGENKARIYVLKEKNGRKEDLER